MIVTTQNYYFQQIKLLLDSIGMNDNVDYAIWQQFIAEWYFEYRKMVYILKTDIP